MPNPNDRFDGGISTLKKENERLKRLLKRSLAPLRFASLHYLDNGMLDQENRTDALVDSIKRALKS